MTVRKCDRCKEEIWEPKKDYVVQLEEWDYSSNFYVDAPANLKRAQICVNCYKDIWGQLF